MSTASDLYEAAAMLFLSKLDAPMTPNMLLAVEAWERVEDDPYGILGNNPWNQHTGPPCPQGARAGIMGLNPSQHLYGYSGGVVGNRYAGAGDQNVAIYASLADGVAASIANLDDDSRAGDWAGYHKVIAAARSGDPMAFLAALARSSWSAGRYGAPDGNPDTNHLVARYLALGGGQEDAMDWTKLEVVGKVVVRPGGSLYQGDPDHPTKHIDSWTWAGACDFVCVTKRADGKEMVGLVTTAFTSQSISFYGKDRCDFTLATSADAITAVINETKADLKRRAQAGVTAVIQGL